MIRRRVLKVCNPGQSALARAVVESLEARRLMHAGHDHFAANVDFQAPSGVVAIPGYSSDIGLQYAQRGNGLTYGWATDNQAGTRDRNNPASPDERYDQVTKMTSSWNIAVPNGTYDVRIVVGDPSPNDSVYKVNVEGAPAVSGTPSETTRFFEKTLTVVVADGKLTVSNASGSIDNRLAFIEIATHQQAAPTTAPAAPSALAASALSTTQIRLRWTDNADNEAGYRIDRKLGDSGTWQQLAELPANAAEFVDNGLAPNTHYVYRVLGFNAAGVSPYSNEESAITLATTPGGTTINWQTVAPNPVARAEAQGAVVNGKLYVLGGLYNGGGGKILATTRSDVYNPATNTWKRLADCPVKVSHSGIVTVGNTIWLIGGYFGDHPGPAGRSVWKYDTAANTWSRGPDLPTSRGAGGAGLVGNKIYFFGGLEKTRTYERADTWALDLKNQSAGWIKKANLLNPRNHTSGKAVGGYVYCIGGQYSQEEGQVAQREIDRYDPVADKWEKVADLPSVRSHINASTFLMNGKILIIGGETAYNTVVRNVTMFDPVTNTFTEMTPLPSARSTSVAGLLNDGRFISSTGNSPAETATTWIGTIS